MNPDEACFLVADDDGLVALAVDDGTTKLSPADAARFASDQVEPEADGPEPNSVTGEWDSEATRLKFVCPVALLVRDGTAELPRSGPRRDGHASAGDALLRLLAEARDGFVPSGENLRLLRPFLAAGQLKTVDQRSAHSESASAYLRPVASEVPADQVGEPAEPGKVPVYSVCSSHIAGVPLALGMLSASLRAHDGGRLCSHFDFRPLRRETATTLTEMEVNGIASVLLFSNYVWSVAANLELSSRVEELCPGSIVIHGGPSTPRYREDAFAFLGDHPEIDVLVTGEGERTVVELMERLSGGLDVDALVGVPGTIVRSSDGEVHFAPPRERVAELSELPSAYLSGVFDHMDGGILDLMPIETNRGCPYGCAFCDWGSATMSRVRSFPIERVFAELDWIVEREVGTIFIADANFGMLPRDLDIARHVSELRRRTGFPKAVLVSFAKNQSLRAAEIVKSWVDAGIATEGSVALQTTSEATLERINRKNIQVERYDELTDEFRKLGLPLAVDLMLGLPGSTVDAFAGDLQKCIDGELTARIYPTVVLPNSPMNEPGYRSENSIRTDAAGVVIGTSSFDDDDYTEMLRLRRIYRSFDHFGVLRHVARWLQHDHAVPAMNLYRTIDELILQSPRDWPNLHWVARHLASYTVPPPDWEDLLSEARRILVSRFGLPEGSAMDTVFAVQAAHLPAPGLSFPRSVALAHDYAAWYTSLTDGPPSGGEVCQLSEFGPATMQVSDPRGICGKDVAGHLRFHPHPDIDSVMLNEFWIADDWELESPVMRKIPQVLMEEQAIPERV